MVADHDHASLSSMASLLCACGGIDCTYPGPTHHCKPRERKRKEHPSIKSKSTYKSCISRKGSGISFMPDPKWGSCGRPTPLESGGVETKWKVCSGWPKVSPRRSTNLMANKSTTSVISCGKADFKSKSPCEKLPKTPQSPCEKLPCHPSPLKKEPCQPKSPCEKIPGQSKDPGEIKRCKPKNPCKQSARQLRITFFKKSAKCIISPCANKSTSMCNCMPRSKNITKYMNACPIKPKPRALCAYMLKSKSSSKNNMSVYMSPCAKASKPSKLLLNYINKLKTLSKSGRNSSNPCLNINKPRDPCEKRRPPKKC